MSSRNVTPPQNKCEPHLMSEIPKQPWEILAIDLKGPFPTGEHILVVIDYYSRYPVTAILTEITLERVIHALQNIFALFGYPNTITSDNGKQFTSAEYKTFLSKHNIKSRTVTPYWPSANGEEERFNRTLGKAIQTSHAASRDWKKDLPGFLLQYRTTPHSSTGIPPAQALFRNVMNNGLPSITPSPLKCDKTIRAADQAAKAKMESYANAKRKARTTNVEEGDMVLVKNLRKSNKLESYFETIPYKVVKTYERSVKLLNSKMKECVRSKAQIKPYEQRNTKIQINPPQSSHDFNIQRTLRPVVEIVIDEDEPEASTNESHSDRDSDATISGTETIPYDESE